MKDCLSCLYEPVWGPTTGIEYPRRSGLCKWDKPMPKMPGVFILRKEAIVRYSDNSGIQKGCKAWEPKTPNVQSDRLAEDKQEEGK